MIHGYDLLILELLISSAFHVLLTPLPTYYLLTTYHPTTYYLLPTTYYLLLTTYKPPPKLPRPQNIP